MLGASSIDGVFVMHCYAIPYGTVGFLNHCILLYVGCCMAWGRRPLWPNTPLSYGRFDICLALAWIIGLMVLQIINWSDSGCSAPAKKQINEINASHFLIMLLETISVWGFLLSRETGDSAGDASDLSRAKHHARGGKHGRKGSVLRDLELAAKEERESPEERIKKEVIEYVPALLCRGGFALSYGYAIYMLAERSQVWKAGGPIQTITSVYKMLGFLTFLWAARKLSSIRHRFTFRSVRKILSNAAFAVAVLNMSYGTWTLGAVAGDLRGLVIGETYPVARYWSYLVVSSLPLLMV